MSSVFPLAPARAGNLWFSSTGEDTARYHPEDPRYPRESLQPALGGWERVSAPHPTDPRRPNHTPRHREQIMASIISLIGPPGSGKGTYGALLASRLLGASFLSVGDVLRENAAANEHLSSILRSGALVDDALVNDAVILTLEKKASPTNGSVGNLVILDGFPRTDRQATLLAQTWPNNLRPAFAVQFDVPDHVCITKLLGRRKCSKCNGSFNVNGVDTGGFDMPPILPKAGACKVDCNPDVDWEKRDDDTAETIQLRMNIYHNETAPVLKYWEERDKLLRFVPYNGVKDMDKLLSLVKSRLDKSLDK